jgi:hypothetical protein
MCAEILDLTEVFYNIFYKINVLKLVRYFMD